VKTKRKKKEKKRKGKEKKRKEKILYIFIGNRWDRALSQDFFLFFSFELDFIFISNSLKLIIKNNLSSLFTFSFFGFGLT